MIRLLIADDEKMEREALADIVMRRFEHEVTVCCASGCWTTA